MKITKRQLRRIIRESLNETGYYSLSAEDMAFPDDLTYGIEPDPGPSSATPQNDYPNNSTMKRLVRQAKLDSRYEPTDEAQLKQDYDKHVRNTLRDPLYDRR